jgi:serine protease Do
MGMSLNLTVHIYSDIGVQVYRGLFNSFPVRIGRSDENEVILSHAEISRQQFSLEAFGAAGFFLLKNLGTKNTATHEGVPFSEIQIPFDRETTVKCSGLNFRFIPKGAQIEETRFFDLRNFPAESHPRPSRFEFLKFFRKMPRPYQFGGAGALALLLFFLLFMGRKTGALSESDLMQYVDTGIFEVVFPKVEDSFVTYEKALPVEKLPFKDRNDKYVSIGTAFFIEGGVFASASHVFDPDHSRPERSYFLRNARGEVFKITEVVGLSSHQDIILFKTETLPSDVSPLKLQRETRVGETVYTAGNAHGEGLALRSGVLSSYTSENLDGAWKYLRYSAPASPGNSGGPLLNTRGEVVGVVVMKSREENLNFAVPVSLLENLPKDHANFVYEGAAEFESGLRLNAERWNLTQPVPQELGKLTTAAATALNHEYLKNRKKFEEKFHSEIFPNDPKLAPYLVEGNLSRKAGFMELDKDKGGKWSVSEEEGQTKNLNSRGSLWYNIDKNGRAVQIELAYYFPKEETVTPYVREPKKLFDLILKELEWSRTFAGERILIHSYGEPQETEKWADPLGRKWVSWIWRSQFDDMSHVLSCLPFPKTISCRWTYAPIHREFLERFYERVDAGRRLRSYYTGNLAQWKEFLKLGDEWIPSVVKEAKVQIQEGKNWTVSLRTQGRDFRFSHARDFDHELGLGVLWNPLKPSTLEVSNISFYENTSAGTFAHLYSIYREARTDGNQAYLDMWKKIAKAEAPYNGIVKTQGDLVSVAKSLKAQLPESSASTAYWLSTCAVSSIIADPQRKSFLSRCQQQWSPTISQTLRAPASVKKKK